MAQIVSIAEASVAPPWLVRAREFEGLKEIIGTRHEPKVLAFFADAYHPQIRDDETAWCAAFACAMLERSGYGSPRKLNARSFLDWGVKLNVPKYGCVVVFKRGNSDWQGHVAFYVGETATHIRHLGGNQSNGVSITSTSKEQLLGYRWPKNAELVKPTPVKDAAKKGAVVVAVGAGGAGAAKGIEKSIEYGLSYFQWSMIVIGIILALAAVWVLWQYGKQWFEKWRVSHMGAEVPSQREREEDFTERKRVIAPNKRKVKRVVKKRKARKVRR